jgi:hypothetical protein
LHTASRASFWLQCRYADLECRLDLAEAAGFCTSADARCGKYLAERAYALLSGLIRVIRP